MTDSGTISMETGTNEVPNKEVDKEEDWISRLCYEHGLFCATHPRLVIFFAAIVVIACSAPLFSLPLFGGSATIEWITLSSSGVSVADSRGKTSRLLQGNDSTIPRWFVGDPLLYIQQFILMAHVSPWQPGLQSKTVVKQALKPAFRITKFITDFQQQLGSHTVNLKDVCLHVTSGPTITQHSGIRLEDQKYLPSKECLLLSPANLWARSMTRFEQDSSILDSLYQEHNQPSFNIALKAIGDLKYVQFDSSADVTKADPEFIFGLPLKQTGIYPNRHAVGSHHVIQYAVTLVLSSHNSRYIDELSKELRNQFPLGLSSEKDDRFTPESEKHNVVHIYYKGEKRFVELAPLCVTYFIVFLYLAFSVAKIEMVKSKWGLAFSAVITVVASLVMAAGVCSFFGLVSTLDSSEIFPYLVIVIGVENILVITKSVVSTPVDLEVKKRVAQGLSKEGWYIFKNLFTEMIILFSGYCTFIPAVQEFFLFAIVGLSTDLFLQMVFFVTVLSIDIRRMELADLQKQMLQVRQGVSTSGRAATTPPSPVPSPPQSPGPVKFTGLMPPLPQASLITPCSRLGQSPVVAKKLPKRLNIAYFWARTRVVQKACMICFVLYFVYVLSYPLLESLDTSEAQAETGSPSSRVEQDDAVKSKQTHQDGKEASLWGPHENLVSSAARGVRVPRREIFLKPPPVELWRGLYKQHWPQLLSYYNISLLGRYVTVLPPVHLGVHLDTELLIPELSKGTNEDLINSQGFPSQDGTEPLGSGQETGSVDEDTADPEYYLNAFYCVVLGVVIMIVLFFVCKFLNDLQVSPRSGLCRRRRGYPCRDLVESLPVSLKGHRQNVEHMKVTMSSIISVCLDGQICVWDIATGELLRAINRTSSTLPDASCDRKLRRRKPKYKRSFDGDSGYTGNEKQLSPRPQSESDSMFLQHLTPEEHGIPVNNGAFSPHKPELKQCENTDDANGDSILSASMESREGLEQSGYDFTGCAEEMSLVSRPSRVSSRGSFNSSWSSVGGDDVGWSSSSEASDDELKIGHNICSHRNSAPAVWCVDCRDDIFVAGCGDGTVEIWSLMSGSPLYESRDSHVGITNVHFLSESNQIVMARLDGMIEFLSLASPCSPGLSVPIEKISPVKRFSPRTARKTYVQSSDVPDATLNAVVSPTGSYACAFSETSPCTVVHRVRAHHQPISVLGVMEGRVITGSHDRTLKVFRTDEFVCVYTLHGHADGITALNVDETNKRQVISGAANGGVRVWDVISGECLQHLRGHVKAVSGVTCTAVHLISISLESVLCIWDRSRGECLHRLKGFPDLCSNVAMLSQSMFITGGQGRLSVWDVLTGRRLRSVLLGNDDTAVFVRHVHVCENATIVCDYGKELKVVSFPADLDKAK